MKQYENRELSWLKFNERVLKEAENAENPICERINFLSIYENNLDEFVMVRVGALTEQTLLEEIVYDDKTGMSSLEQIQAIFDEMKKLEGSYEKVYQMLVAELKDYGFLLREYKNLPEEEKYNLHNYFQKELLPLLSPVVVGKKQPFPFLENKAIYAVALLQTKHGKQKLGLVPCGKRWIPRWIPVGNHEYEVILSEDFILNQLDAVFSRYSIKECCLIRVTRNADLDFDKLVDSDLDFRDSMEHIIRERRRLAPIRLEILGENCAEIEKNLCYAMSLDSFRVIHKQTPLNIHFLKKFENKCRKNTEMIFPKQKPKWTKSLVKEESVISQIHRKDRLLSYPYESFKPFIQLLKEAAVHAEVESISITLYRLAKKSKVIKALIAAAKNGKKVRVMIELKARFDENNNIECSKKLEDAGCEVIYGMPRLKVHAKLCIIKMREESKLKNIVQIGTGNYNEKTAKLYTDFALMTADERLSKEAEYIFECLTERKIPEERIHLLVSPKNMQEKILQKMNREIAYAKKGEKAYIGIKVNSLSDKTLIDKLIEAVENGVRVELAVRGICCLSQEFCQNRNIAVNSVVGRYLEHARIYIFGVGEREEIYLSSADFMTRNMIKRIEVAVPVFDSGWKKKIRNMFELMMLDNVKGSRERKKGEAVDSQNLLYQSF